MQGSHPININPSPDPHTTRSMDVLRSKVAEAHTRLIGGYIYDTATGECYGEYTSTPYLTKPAHYTADLPARQGEDCSIEHGSAASPLASVNNSHYSEPAPVIVQFPQKTLAEARPSSTRGPKPQVIHNLLAPALCILKFEERLTPWLDDIVFGAIYTGPGVIAGKHSVSLPDVMSVLRLSVISIAAAANCLLNHELRPMSTRQLQRVIEAARTALRGIALYLERHPQILQSIDLQVDFDTFWSPPQAAPTKVPSNEHPMKQQALMMIKAEVPVKTIAKALGISKNTAKQWKQAATRANYREGSVEGN